MDILILNWKDVKNPEAGGAEIIAFEFARRLVKDGHKVSFFCREFDNCLPEETIEGVKIVRRGSRISVYPSAFFYYLGLRKKPDRVIDMINTLCWQTPFYVPRKKRIAYLNQLAKEVLYYEFSRPLSYISYFLERFEYLPYRNTKFLCYSESTKNDLISFGVKEDKIKIFPLGLDHDRYKPGKTKTKFPSFVFVARLVKMKRAELCVEAMRKVSRKYPEARLYIVGNGPDEGNIEKLIKKLGLRKNVVMVTKNNFFIDKNVKDVKLRLMQEAWALLLPSVKEGWGMVVTEAAACGTPSIVSNVTGLRDSVVKNKTGLILSKNPTPKEMSEAILKIIEDKETREKFSSNAIKWSKNFNWDKSYQTFKKLL
jgi:glycosyltransferase involved in cell wall biosynthesis